MPGKFLGEPLDDGNCMEKREDSQQWVTDHDYLWLVECTIHILSFSTMLHYYDSQKANYASHSLPSYQREIAWPSKQTIK